MMLQKLALLWMLQDKRKESERNGKNGKLVARKERKEKGKDMKSPQGPEARKPRSSWRKALEPLTFRIRISRYLHDLAATYAERDFMQTLEEIL